MKRSYKRTLEVVIDEMQNGWLNPNISFDYLLMAAFLQADKKNINKLKKSFPEQYKVFLAAKEKKFK